jgi:WD40 repeat protein
VWKVDTGEEQFERQRGHNSDVLCLAFSPDGQLVASGSGDQTIVIRGTLAGSEPLILCRGNRLTVYSISFSPDGKRLVSGGEDGTVRLWDATPPSFAPAIRTPLRTIDEQNDEGRVLSVAFNPNGEKIAAGTRIGFLNVWKSNLTGRPVRSSQKVVMYTSIHFSPDSRLLVGGGIRWDIDSRNEGSVFTGSGYVTAMAFRPDGNRVVAASSDGIVRLWDPNERFDNPLQTFQLGPTGGAINQLIFTPDGRHLITANANGTVYVLRLKEWSAK